MNDPQLEGSHGKLRRTTKILGDARRRSGCVAARGARAAGREGVTRCPMPEPPVPPPPDPLLTRASVTFHTNDDDKDNDTLVEVEVRLSDQTVVAKLSDHLGHFPDHSDAGPFVLLMVHPARR